MRVKLHINKLLYRDALRQLRTVGILGMVTFCLSAILTAFGFWISNQYYITQILDGKRAPIGVSLYQSHWILFAAIYVLTPIMTMIMFGFLNRRNASDFYHAIPDRRETLYASYVAAIFTWIAAIVLVSSAVSLISFGLLPGYYMIWTDVPGKLFVILSACVLVMGSFLIAKSFTGTVMSNLLVALVIMIVPRLFITVLLYGMQDMLGFVIWDYSPMLANPRYNIPLGLVISALMGNENPLQYWSSGVYTLVLGVIYIIVGGLIFMRRKSESAGQAAISSKLQTVFRLLVSLSICLISILQIARAFIEPQNWNGDDFFIVLVVYVIAILVYFIYELITSGKLRQFMRLCRGLLFLAALNVALIGGLVAGCYIVSAKIPKAEDIKYIKTLGDEDDYYRDQVNQLRITDEEILRITAAAFERTVEYYRGRGQNITTDIDYVEYAEKYGYGVANPVTGEVIVPQTRYVTKKIAINTGMETLYRRVRYTEAEWERIVELLSEMEAFQRIYRELPETDGMYANVTDSSGRLGREQAMIVYEVMREEIDEIDFTEWFKALNSGNYDEFLDMLVYYSNSNDISSRYYYTHLPILKSMERTVACYFEQLGVNSDPVDPEDWEMMEQVMFEDELPEDCEYVNSAFLNIEITLYDADWTRVEERYYYLDGYSTMEDGKVVFYQSDNGMGDEWKEACRRMIDNIANGSYDTQVKNEFIYVNINGHVDVVGKDGQDHSYGIDKRSVIALDDGIPEEIRETLQIEDIYFPE